MFNVGGEAVYCLVAEINILEDNFNEELYKKNAIGSETGLMDESENLSVKKNHLSLFQSWFKLFQRVLVQWEQPCL